MTVLARRFAGPPVRTSSETWGAIVDVLAPDAGSVRSELTSASGVLAMIIADEVTRSRPIVVSGAGPQIRIYTVHGVDAIEGMNVNEAALAVTLEPGSFSISAPAPEGDDEWMPEQLSGCAHITVASESGAASASAGSTPRPAAVPIIDLTELRNT